MPSPHGQDRRVIFGDHEASPTFPCPPCPVFLLILAFPKFNAEIVAWAALIPFSGHPPASLPKPSPSGFVPVFPSSPASSPGSTTCSLSTATCRERSVFSSPPSDRLPRTLFSAFAFALRWVEAGWKFPKPFLHLPSGSPSSTIRGFLFRLSLGVFRYSQYLTLPWCRSPTLPGCMGFPF